MSESILLYSQECCNQLSQACEYVQQHSKETTRSLTPSSIVVRPSNAFEFFDQAASDDDDNETKPKKTDDEEGETSDSEASASSSASSKSLDEAPTESGEAKITTVVPPLTSEAQNGSDAPASTVAAKPKTFPAKPMNSKKKDQKQREREQQIKHHSMNLNRTSFPLDSDNVSTSGIHLPTSLLTREQQQSPSQLEQCQAYRDLATKLQKDKHFVVVLLIRSGRFAGAVFQGPKCVQHTSSQRYTVRKGQGKAQSSQDGRRRPKSMGSQLRRAGEQSLKEDIQTTLQDWSTQYIAKAALLLISCPKTMRSTLFEGPSPLTKSDSRLTSIPFDVGRPSFEGANIVYETMMNVVIGDYQPVTYAGSNLTLESSLSQPLEAVKEETTSNDPATAPSKKEEEILIPLTLLHEAARDGNLATLLELLQQESSLIIIDQRAGYDFMTPLHFAAESSTSVDPLTAAACISALLIQGLADPTVVDARLRLPYFLASNDKTREAFRKARALLGEEAWEWDALAKVGPPLTDDDLALKKEKEAEKKRRKKAKQKERKAKDMAQAEELEKQRQEEELQAQKEQEAKRIRDALPPGTAASASAPNVCDFCQTVVKGRKGRQQMLTRLDYKYCSTDCVQKHKRELMAKAAMQRFQ